MEIQTPKFLADANDGDLIDLARQSLSFDDDRPVVTDYKIRGIVSNFNRVQGIRAPYIECDLTDADGTVHHIQSGTNAHIWIVTYDGNYDQSLDQSDWDDDQVAATIGDPSSPTWGTPHNRGFICKADQSETDVIVARFTRMELDYDEVCQRCGKNVSPSTEPMPVVPGRHKLLSHLDTLATVLDAGPNGVDVSWDLGADGNVASYTWADIRTRGWVFTEPPTK